MVNRKLHLRLGIAVSVAALCLSFAATALAGRGGNSGKPGGGSGSSLTLVPLNSTDGLPHWDQQVRFDVSTSATTEPHVSLKCYQDGDLVYTTQTGYYASYPWPWTQTMTLSSRSWTGGAADCNATLYYFSRSDRIVTLATLGFHVYE